MAENRGNDGIELERQKGIKQSYWYSIKTLDYISMETREHDGIYDHASDHTVCFFGSLKDQSPHYQFFKNRTENHNIEKIQVS